MQTQPAENLFNKQLEQIGAARAKSNRKIFVPEYARFKLQFIERNNKTSIPYHSFDFYKGAGGKNFTNEEQGLLTLYKWIDKKRMNDEFVVATIWANCTNDLRTYINGRLNMSYDFIVFKQVRGQQPMTSKFLRFKDGKVDVPLLLKSL